MKNKLAYEQFNDFLYEYTNKQVDENNASCLWAVYIKYSYNGKDWNNSCSVFNVDFCDQTICWFNDWWEGEPYISLIGIFDIEETFNNGDYHVLIKEFKDNE